MREGASIAVRVLKYDGSEHRRWRARIARTEGALIVLAAEFDLDVDHHLLGPITRGTRTVEFYWLDRWYSVFRFLKDDGATRLFYCNVNTPPLFENKTLSYIDLDVDLLVQPDLSYEVLDLEEYEVNAGRYGYSEEVRARTRASVDELKIMIETRQFPFHDASIVSASPVGF